MQAKNFRIEYETSDMFYKAHIIATSTEEALLFLRKVQTKQFKITSTSDLGPVDAITKEAAKLLVVEKGEESEENLAFKCPWCDDFSAKTEKGLQIHIGRAHKEK